MCIAWPAGLAITALAKTYHLVDCMAGLTYTLVGVATKPAQKPCFSQNPTVSVDGVLTEIIATENCYYHSFL